MFLYSDAPQKELAIEFGVSEMTFSKWVKEGNWKEEKDALAQSDELLYLRMTKRINKVMTALEANDIMVAEDGTEMSVEKSTEKLIAESRLLDTLISTRSKLMLLGYSEVARVSGDFLRHIADKDLEVGKKLVPLMKSFLETQKPIFRK